jgi:hypothetical protein
MEKPMRICMSWLLAGTLAGNLSAQVGRPMPALDMDRVYNFDALKLKRLAQLRGSAVYVLYWQTW